MEKKPRTRYFDNLPVYEKYLNKKGQEGLDRCFFKYSPEYFKKHPTSCECCHYLKGCIARAQDNPDCPEWRDLVESRVKVY